MNCTETVDVPTRRRIVKVIVHPVFIERKYMQTAVASDKGVTVAVDTELSPELVQEGYGRDIVRQVNNMRKDAGLEIIGFYHSHPDWPAIPSQTDIDFAWEGMFYLIVSVHQGRPFNTTFWQLTEEKPRRFEQAALVIVDENALDGDKQE